MPGNEGESGRSFSSSSRCSLLITVFLIFFSEIDHKPLFCSDFSFPFFYNIVALNFLMSQSLRNFSVCVYQNILNEVLTWEVFIQAVTVYNLHCNLSYEQAFKTKHAPGKGSGNI